MPSVLLPILCISVSQLPIVDYKQILRIILLGCLAEVERHRDYGFPIDDHDLVVSDGVLSISLGWNT